MYQGNKFAFRFSLPPNVLVANPIRGHAAGSRPPSSLRFVPCFFVARRLQPLLPSIRFRFFPRLFYGTFRLSDGVQIVF